MGKRELKVHSERKVEREVLLSGGHEPKTSRGSTEKKQISD